MDRPPRLFVDHVLIAVRDLESAISGFASSHGLTALPGGRHPGAGTANAIVPLRSSYLELIAVVDRAEAASSARSRRIAEAVLEGHTFAGWALRTEDLAAVRDDLLARGWDLPAVTSGSRLTPDGHLLSWEVQELSAGDLTPELPFLIQWQIEASQHPGRMEVQHAAGDARLLRVVVGHPEPAAAGARLAELRRRLGGDVDVQFVRTKAPCLLSIDLSLGVGRLTLS